MNKQTNPSQTILSIVVGLVAFSLLLHVNLLAQIAFGIGLIALLSVRFAEIVSRLWLKFAQVLGRVNGYVLLTIIFFVFLTPIALLMRFIQKADNLKLKPPGGDSIYETRNHTYEAKDLTNIW
jgi:Saxitoxin biosynthesis operon protein SxtJ